MRFIQIPKNNLAKRPLRTLLTCFGVALGVASLIALVGLSRGVERAWTTGLMEKGTHILGMRKGAAEILTATLDEKLGRQLRTVKGLEAVSGELVDLIQLESGAAVLISGWPAQSYLWQTLSINGGDQLVELAPNEVVVGQSIAAALGYQVGRSIGIGGLTYGVKAISKSRGPLNNNTIVMRLDDMQKMTGKTGRVTVFNLRLRQTENRRQVVRLMDELRRRFDGLAFQETRDIVDNNKILELFRAIAWGTASIALVICGFVVLNTLLMSVTERKREIGIYCALGWKPSRIILMIAIEAFIITLVGAVAGCLMGGAGLHWLVRATELRAYIEPHLDLRILIETIFASIILGTLACIYPAWRAVRISPTEALRYE
jgi:putative ABC transport system permease protein